MRNGENLLYLARKEQCLALGTQLTDEHRAVLALRVDADLSYADIAVALGIPIGTVMSRLARAREALLEEMRALSPKRRMVDPR